MEPVIRVTGVSKQYRIGSQKDGYRTFREAIIEAAASPFPLFRRRTAASIRNTIWALKDVSLEIQQGEVVGIIGRNGAGKSTLLKILSRITRPTQGRVELRGTVASLLEIGVGFHPELTGRENIYLNGVILGMKKGEIERKFDEIVEFSEIEKFLDTPVKYYSSGMYVRLAFAVAAHLDPEILLVDEVLAVGDLAFQKKCLGKMEGVAKEGRTVLFVSHNMGAITGLCEIAMWINEGKIVAQGPAPDIVSHYLSSLSSGNAQWERSQSQPRDSSKARIVSARVCAMDSKNTHLVGFTDAFIIELVYEVLRPMRCTAGFRLRNESGLSIFVSSEGDTTDWAFRIREPGIYCARAMIPGRVLRPGSYFLTFGLYVENAETIDRYENALTFEITPDGSPLSDGRDGILTPILRWEVERIADEN